MSADLATLDLPALTAEAERLGYVRYDDLRWLGLGGRSVVYNGNDEAAALRWLLATPEARRLAAIVDAAEARGRKQSALDDDIAHYREHDACWALLAGWRTLTLDAAIPLELAEAEARGREAERADVVAWLRDIADGTRARPDSRWDDVVDTLDAVVDDVGRGLVRQRTARVR